MPFLTPDETEGVKGRVLHIPSHYLAAVSGALKRLGDLWEWEEHGDITPQEAAEFFGGFFDAYLNSRQVVMRVYLASVTNSGTNNPTTNVIANTLGRSVTWTRDISGTPPFYPIYKAAFSATIDQNTMMVFNASHFDPSIGDWLLKIQQWDYQNPTTQLNFYPFVGGTRADLNGLYAFIGLITFE